MKNKKIAFLTSKGGKMIKKLMEYVSLQAI